MAKQIRVVISPKHPQGAIWLLTNEGWAILEGSISQLGSAFDGGILAMDATMTVGDSLVTDLLNSSPSAPELITLPHRECCQGD